MRLGVVAVALMTVGACAEPGAVGRGQAPIVNGELDPFDPGIVALTISGRSFCTGTLVSPRVVVTAAHCVDEGTADEIWVQVGVRVGLGEGVRVLQGKVHDEYTGGSNDIALLLLEQPAPARPWPLNRTAFDNSFLGKELRVAGYGATDPDGGGDGNKRTGVAAITSFDALDFVYVSAPAQTCFGDSGGPGFVTLEDGVEYLAGVTSRGDADCAEFGVDTRVDTYADWVDFFIQVNDPTITDCGDDGTCALDCAEPDPDCPCEADGYCTTACETLAYDRDCPPNCDFDGVCQTDAGCPVEDIDCHPTAGIGEPCVFDTSCVEGTCIPALEDDRVTYCSEPCSADDDCPGDMICTDDPDGGDPERKCRHLAPSPGAQGWPCTQDSECFEQRCLPASSGSSERLCSNRCVADEDCGDGNTCERHPDGTGERVCLPEASGCGCGAGGRTGTGAWPLLALLVGFVARSVRGVGAKRRRP